MIVAEDEVRIRNMKENREIGDVSALSSQYNAGNEAMQMGIGQTIAGGGAIANYYSKEAIDARKKERQNKANDKI
jgi:hypothetical protein